MCFWICGFAFILQSMCTQSIGHLTKRLELISPFSPSSSIAHLSFILFWFKSSWSFQLRVTFGASRASRCELAIVAYATHARCERVEFWFWAVSFRVYSSSKVMWEVGIINVLGSIDGGNLDAWCLDGAMSAFHINLLNQTYARGMEMQPFAAPTMDQGRRKSFPPTFSFTSTKSRYIYATAVMGVCDVCSPHTQKHKLIKAKKKKHSNRRQKSCLMNTFEAHWACRFPHGYECSLQLT